MKTKHALYLFVIVGLAAALLAATAFLFSAEAEEPAPDQAGSPRMSGGPDLFGYTYRDSNELGGPVYAWEEISGSGALVGGWTSYDDGYAGPIPLGFTFDFYGANYAQLYVGTNGYVSFGSGYGGYNLIALFSGDLYLLDYGTQSAVYYQTLSSPTRFVLEFVNIHWCCGYNTPHTFELILYPNGDIVARYRSLGGDNPYYVGIRNANGTDGLDYGASLTDALAICYYYPKGMYLTPASQQGNGIPGATVTYSLALENQTSATDSFTLALGSHAWDSVLSTNLVGPLDDGQSAAFEVYVTVPAGADWYTTDTVVVTATSVLSPTGYVGTAFMTTEAYAPPQISISPDGLASTQYVNEMTTQPITISNGSGVPLTFTIEDAWMAPGLVRVAPLDLPPAALSLPQGKVQGRGSDERHATAVPAPTVGVSRVLAKGVERSAAIQAGRYYTTTVDNEDNYHSGNPDGDMDTGICGGYFNEPIEFNIFVDGPVSATGNVLIVRAYDVDPLPEIDQVRLNGVYLGDLAGADDTWSDTAFDISAGGVRFGRNLVEIDISSSEWCVQVDWGELFGTAVDVPWLAESPDSGTVPSNGSQQITVTFDATDVQPDDYLASILIHSNDPLLPLVSLPVTLTVLPDPDMGWVEGTVTDVADKAPLVATVEALGQPYQVSTDPATGHYRLWLRAGSYMLQASASGYVTDAAVVQIVAGQGTVRDFALVLNVPVMEVTPASLAASQEVGDVTTHTLTIANLGPAELVANLATPSNSLESLLENLNAKYQGVVDAIPNRYDFSEGVTGYYIGDGDNDMYDGGNYLSTSLGGSILYSDNAIADSPFFGANGRYFTRKYPGLFVLAAEMQGVDHFEISGNLGADGSGAADGGILQTEHYGVTYYGFVKRVYNAGDPSVNHLVIAADVPAADQTYSADTGDDSHRVSGLETATRLFYLLYAGSNGAYIDDSAARDIMEAFLDAAGAMPAAPWLSVEPASTTVPGYDSRPVTVTLDANGLQPGEYVDRVDIHSNDPANPSVSVPVTMTVQPPPDWGRVAGSVSDAWTELPLTATVELVGIHSMTARPDFEIWAKAGSYSLMAYADGYYTVTHPVTIVAGDVTAQDIALEPAQPRLEWSPPSISATVVEGTIGVKTLAIDNTGPLPLEVDFFEINPAQRLRALTADDLAGKRILYDRVHGEAYLTDNFSTLVSDLEAAGATVTENFTYPVTPAVLAGYDVLWVACCGDTNWGYRELSAIDGWMDQGGAVFVHGSSSYATTGPASIFGISYRSGKCTNGTTTDISAHPISEGIDSVYVAYSCYWLAAGSDATVVVGDLVGQPHVVAQEQSGGKMVVLASDDLVNWAIDYAYADNRLLANNIFAWLARPAYSNVPWLSVSPDSAVIPGHEDRNMSVQLDASTLSPGSYQAILAIEHNDPDQGSPVEVPVALTVVAPVPGVSLAPDQQEGSALSGEMVVYTLTVTNEGNFTDSFDLAATGNWPANLSASSTGPLVAGASSVLTLAVQVPSDAIPGQTDTTTVVARSAFASSESDSAQVKTVVEPRIVYLPLITKNNQ